MIYQAVVQGSYKMRVGWFFPVLILAMLIGKEASANPGAAWSECLHSNAKQLAGGKRPSEADAKAAILNCRGEEDAVRDFFEQAKSASGGLATTDPYSRIPADDLIAEFRRRFIWEINYPLSPKP
jgi:hypothetical protein